MADVRIPLLNNVQLAGRITRDPEIITTQSGKRLAKFTVAYSRKSGDSEEKLFLDCTAWEKSADTAAKLLKGAPVLMEGQLRQEEWEDKTTGQRRTKICCTVNRLHPLVWSPETAQGGPNATQGGSAPPEPIETPYAGEQEDIPF